MAINNKLYHLVGTVLRPFCLSWHRANRHLPNLAVSFFLYVLSSLVSPFLQVTSLERSWGGGRGPWSLLSALLTPKTRPVQTQVIHEYWRKTGRREEGRKCIPYCGFCYQCVFKISKLNTLPKEERCSRTLL